MNWDKKFNEKQMKRLSKIKNPTVTKIIELAKELDLPIELVGRYFIERNSKQDNKK